MKKRILKKTFFLFTLLGLLSVQTNGQETFSSGLNGWNKAFGSFQSVSHNATEGVKSDGALVVTRETNNSGFGLVGGGIDADTNKWIKIRYKNESNATSFRVQGSKETDNVDGIQQTIFNITAGTAGNGVWETAFIDMTGRTNWDGTINNLDILVRGNYAAGEGLIYIDEIEFLSSDKNYSEFVQSPSFEDNSGLTIFSGTKTFVTRDIETSANAKDGVNNLRFTYTGDPDSAFFTFSSFQKTYGGVDFPIGTVLQVKMWVKKSTASILNIITRIKTEELGGATSVNETATQNTSTAQNTWEQLTFDVPITAASDAFTFWIGIGHNAGGGSSNPANGDVIQIDKITSAVFPVKTSTTDGTWESAATWGGTLPDQGDLKTIDNDVTINSAVVSDGPVTINATKTLTIKAGNSLTLNSDLTTNDGLVLEPGAQLIVTGNATGNATYQRTLTATDNGAAANLEGWFSVSPPVSGETLDTAWADANSLATGTGANRGIATYTEADDTWSYFTGTATTFEAGKGYTVKRTTDGMISFNGSINTSDDGVNIAVTKTGNGFNLLGNPYTSVINSATFISDNSSNLEVQQIWIWNDNGNTYEAKTAGISFKVAPGQAFFVQANAAATLNFAESNQEVGADTFQRSSETKIKLTVDDGQMHRYAEVYYIENKTLGYDVGYEGEVFGGIQDSFSLYTHLLEDNQGKKYQIQALPDSDFESMIVPVGVKADAGKEITFSVEALNLPTDLKVFLEDKVTNTFIRLDEANTDYTITLPEALNGIGRFYIHTSASALSVNDVALGTVSIYKSDISTLRIAGLPQGNASIKLFNILGKQLMSTSFEVAGVKELSLPNLATGVYIVQLQTEVGTLNKKIILE